MKQFSFTIKDPAGIHARPAGVVVQEAKKFQSTVTVKCNGKTGDFKRIFTVLALCAKCGQVLEIEVSGPDEEAAAAAVKTALESKL
ncbi:MAG: HPr family phosphocarrier protein [Mycoplasmoidaceae bacterium]|nr:HPr family phosphocarrier protein [Mycoplasmoidaceae bacterium]